MYWFGWSCGTLSDHISNHRGQITLDTQKLELIPKTKSTKLRNEVITSLSFFDYYIKSKLIVHKFNFLIEYYLSEIFGNGCKRRTRSCNWIQRGPVTINKRLIIVWRHENSVYWPEILCKSVVWSGAPSDRKYRSLSPG